MIFCIGITVSEKSIFNKLIDKFKNIETDTVDNENIISFNKTGSPFYFIFDNNKNYDDNNLIEIGMELFDKSKLFYKEHLKNILEDSFITHLTQS